MYPNTGMAAGPNLKMSPSVSAAPQTEELMHNHSVLTSDADMHLINLGAQTATASLARFSTL